VKTNFDYFIKTFGACQYHLGHFSQAELFILLCMYYQSLCMQLIVHFQLSDLNGIDDDELTVRILIHLSCSKRSVRLSKGAKRKTYCPSLVDCLNSFVIFAQVSEMYSSSSRLSDFSCRSINSNFITRMMFNYIY